ncbi:mucin-12 [Anaeramoeba ignava]|uniref:Mucin-12 n=1 Tax=Anaeramoeba ignava TaxID=1746090 RepID=A0A9Q0LR60_ANAIG|nr:mucin-12 [Anaeramoeba ignava]
MSKFISSLIKICSIKYNIEIKPEIILKISTETKAITNLKITSLKKSTIKQRKPSNFLLVRVNVSSTNPTTLSINDESEEIQTIFIHSKPEIIGSVCLIKKWQFVNLPDNNLNRQKNESVIYGFSSFMEIDVRDLWILHSDSETKEKEKKELEIEGEKEKITPQNIISKNEFVNLSAKVIAKSPIQDSTIFEIPQTEYKENTTPQTQFSNYFNNSSDNNLNILNQISQLVFPRKTKKKIRYFYLLEIQESKKKDPILVMVVGKTSLKWYSTLFSGLRYNFYNVIKVDKLGSIIYYSGKNFEIQSQNQTQSTTREKKKKLKQDPNNENTNTDMRIEKSPNEKSESTSESQSESESTSESQSQSQSQSQSNSESESESESESDSNESQPKKKPRTKGRNHPKKKEPPKIQLTSDTDPDNKPKEEGSDSNQKKIENQKTSLESKEIREHISDRVIGILNQEIIANEISVGRYCLILPKPFQMDIRGFRPGCKLEVKFSKKIRISKYKKIKCNLRTQFKILDFSNGVNTPLKQKKAWLINGYSDYSRIFSSLLPSNHWMLKDSSIPRDLFKKIYSYIFYFCNPKTLSQIERFSPQYSNEGSHFGSEIFKLTKLIKLNNFSNTSKMQTNPKEHESMEFFGKFYSDHQTISKQFFYPLRFLETKNPTNKCSIIARVSFESNAIFLGDSVRLPVVFQDTLPTPQLARQKNAILLINSITFANENAYIKGETKRVNCYAKLTQSDFFWFLLEHKRFKILETENLLIILVKSKTGITKQENQTQNFKVEGVHFPLKKKKHTKRISLVFMSEFQENFRLFQTIHPNQLYSLKGVNPDLFQPQTKGKVEVIMNNKIEISHLIIRCGSSDISQKSMFELDAPFFEWNHKRQQICLLSQKISFENKRGLFTSVLLKKPGICKFYNKFWWDHKSKISSNQNMSWPFDCLSVNGFYSFDGVVYKKTCQSNSNGEINLIRLLVGDISRKKFVLVDSHPNFLPYGLEQFREVIFYNLVLYRKNKITKFLVSSCSSVVLRHEVSYPFLFPIIEFPPTLINKENEGDDNSQSNNSNLVNDLQEFEKNKKIINSNYQLIRHFHSIFEI